MYGWRVQQRVVILHGMIGRFVFVEADSSTAPEANEQKSGFIDCQEKQSESAISGCNKNSLVRPPVEHWIVSRKHAKQGSCECQQGDALPYAGMIQKIEIHTGAKIDLDLLDFRINHDRLLLAFR
jgi:hypothetical protein